MMRITVLTPEYLPSSGGGIITFYLGLLPVLVASNHQVRVVSGSGVFALRDRRRIEIDGVSIEALEFSRLQKWLQRLSYLAPFPGLRRHLAAAWAMWEQAEEGGEADIIEACDWGLSFLPAVLNGQRPVVVQAHGSVGQIDRYDPVAGEEAQGVLTRMLEASGMARAADIQTSSGSNADAWRMQTGRDVTVIRPGWRAPNALAETGLSDAGLVLGRVQDWKGPRVLCEALTLLGARAPSIDWVGRDTLYREQGRMTSQMLASEFPSVWNRLVRHFPPVTQDEARRLQRGARFIIVPSTWDVFNFTCVEGMASGRPVVCSTGAGASELIVDGKNGFVFQNGDASSLATAIDRVMSLDKAQLAQIGAAAQATVMTELDPRRIAAKRHQRYKEVIAGFEPQPAAADDWLRDACSGRDKQSDELAFLDHLPLRSLIGYGFRRLGAKIVRGGHV